MTDPYYNQHNSPYDPRYGEGNYAAPRPYDGGQQHYDYPAANQPVSYGGYGAYSPYPPVGYPVPAPYGYDPVSGEPLSDKSKIAAGLLQLFLGGFGAGRFYLGHNGIAATQLVLYLLGFLLSFVFIGIPLLLGVGLWVFIDAILMFAGSVRDAQGRVLRS